MSEVLNRYDLFRSLLTDWNDSLTKNSDFLLK